MNGKNYITASEIGEYVYCPRGWWLKLKSPTQTTSQMIRGIAHHQSIFSRIEWSPRIKLIALLLIGIALMVILIIIQYITG